MLVWHHDAGQASVVEAITGRGRGGTFLVAMTRFALVKVTLSPRIGRQLSVLSSLTSRSLINVSKHERRRGELVAIPVHRDHRHDADRRQRAGLAGLSCR
jgi:hypothetical protein